MTTRPTFEVVVENCDVNFPIDFRIFRHIVDDTHIRYELRIYRMRDAGTPFEYVESHPDDPFTSCTTNDIHIDTHNPFAKGVM